MIKKKEFWHYFLLNLITCGIYGIIFWYKCTEDINEMCKDDYDPSLNYILVMILGIITCGFYMYYWNYKQARRLYDYSQKYNIRKMNTGSDILIWMILGTVICGIGFWVAKYMLIENINLVADEYNKNNNYSE